MDVLTIVLFFVIGAGAFAGGYFLSRVLKGKQLQMTEKEAASIKDMAHREADTIKKEAELQAKDTLLKLRHDFEQDTKTRREELSVAEKRILQKEESVEKRLDLLDKAQDAHIIVHGHRMKGDPLTNANEPRQPGLRRFHGFLAYDAMHFIPFRQKQFR